MTDQPTKTKQQLLDELESIMSMLDDDSVIPTLDAVVDATAEASAETEASTEAEVGAEESKEEELSFTHDSDEAAQHFDEIDISIPDIDVPDTTALFGESPPVEVELKPEQSARTASRAAATENPFLKGILERPSLLKGEQAAEAPLPGQQQLFDNANNDKIEDQAKPDGNVFDVAEQELAEQTSSAEQNSPLPDERPSNPFKNTSSQANTLDAHSSSPMASADESTTLTQFEQKIAAGAIGPGDVSWGHEVTAAVPEPTVEPIAEPAAEPTPEPAAEPSERPILSWEDSEPQALKAPAELEPASLDTEIEPDLNTDSDTVEFESGELEPDAPDLDELGLDGLAQDEFELAAVLAPEEQDDTEALVDELVTKYLPQIEAELRARLLSMLDDELGL